MPDPIPSSHPQDMQLPMSDYQNTKKRNLFGKRKLLLPITIIVAVAAIMFIKIIIGTQGIPQLKNMKTYDNDKDTYSVAYPEDFLSPVECTPGKFILMDKNDADCPKNGAYDFEIVTYSETPQAPHGNTFIKVAKEDITINGITSQSYVLSSQNTTDEENVYWEKRVYIPTAGKTYVMYMRSKELEPAFDAMLKTFKPKEQAQSSSPEGKFCGGIAANLPENQCPEGYTCKLEGKFPDAGGTCVKS